MSLEIRELVIKASVVNQRKDANDNSISRSELKKIKKEIINECLERLMQKIEEDRFR